MKNKKILTYILFILCMFLGPLNSKIFGEVELIIPDESVLGQAFLVKVQSGKPFQSVKLVWLKKEVEIPVKSNGAEYIAKTLLGTDVKYSDPGEKNLIAEVKKGPETIVLKKTIQIKEKKYPEQHLKVPDKMIHLSESALKRVRRENQIIDKILNTVTFEQWLNLPLKRPVEGKIVSIYGLKRFYNGEPRSPHRGVDFRGTAGELIHACNGGRVLLVDNHYFAGNSVYLDHGCGIISVYFHLSKTSLEKGQWIDRGEKVGLIGATGRATGPHLHFGLYILGQAIDPVPLFK